MTAPHRVQPITDWSIFSHDPSTRVRSRFDSPWSSTLADLDREVAYLQNGTTRWACDPFVLLMDVPATAIRKDGQIYASAKVNSPAVAVVVESEDKGTLTFPCDTFWGWQDNVRAIAIAMENFRRIDRYGVGQGRQYVGMAPQIGMAMPGATGRRGMTEAQARKVLVDYARAGADTTLGDHELRKQAIKNTHPDRHGETMRKAFEDVVAAAEILGV